VTRIDTGHAVFRVLVFPFRRAVDGVVYALFRREDAGYWQGVAGGGEVGESPLEAARSSGCRMSAPNMAGSVSMRRARRCGGTPTAPRSGSWITGCVTARLPVLLDRPIASDPR
jgi:hypothetical protein